MTCRLRDKKLKNNTQTAHMAAKIIDHKRYQQKCRKNSEHFFYKLVHLFPKRIAYQRSKRLLSGTIESNNFKTTKLTRKNILIGPNNDVTVNFMREKRTAARKK